MKLLLLLIALALASTTTLAHLSDYPFPFIQYGSFEGQIIVGAAAPSTDALAATEIATSLQQQSSTLITAGTDDEFNPSKNAILIGLPCHNKAMVQVLETDACSIGLNEGEGFLKIIEGSAAYLIVTGNSPADTRKAARFLSGNELSGLETHETRIIGTLDNPAAKTEAPLVIKKTSAEAECETDTDCREDESCIAAKCLALGCWEGTIAKNHDCIPTAQEAEQTGKPQQPPETAEAEAAQKATDESDANSEQEEPQGLLAKVIAFILSIFS